MNHRRLRLPAAMAILALAAPVFAQQTATGDEPPSAVGRLQRDAREFGTSVHDDSVQLGHQVAQSFHQGVHQARHQFTLSMRHAGSSIRHWWDNARDTVERI